MPSFNEIVEELPLKKDRVLVVNNPEDIPHDFIDLQSEIKSKSISKTNPDTTFNSILRQTALYIFSSGTTGLPKAIIMQNYRLYYQTLSVVMATCQLSSSDVIYIAMPLYHNLAIGMPWMAAVLSGAGVALRKRFSASEFWKDIHKYHATFMMYVGEIPRYLLNQPPSEYEKNHTLKKVAGVGLRKRTWEKFKSRFQIDHIYEFYGITEGTGGFLNVDEAPGMVGRNNLPGIVLAKVDPETGEFYRDKKGFCVKCKPGDIGMALNELDKGTFFTGYKDKEKTQKKLMYNVFEKNDTYFNTGDMLKLHENLWVSFADRFGDTFRWKGENVSTLEVETILNSYPPIQMCAVYGVAIPNTEGTAGMAAIKLNPSTDFEIDDFSRFVVNVLPRYSIPIFIRIRNELELTGPLKIKKTNLRREAYDVNSIQDQLFFWDSSTKKYVALDKSIYQNILEGKLKI